ncbi:hypothetical protein ACHAXM_001522 [Skeletonema potamos]
MLSDKPPKDSEQQRGAVEGGEDETYVGVVDPPPSEDTGDEADELRAKFEKANQMIKTQNTAYQRAIRKAALENEKANQMIKTQNTAYQRAIRRAVLENDYVSKINNKLVQKIEAQTRELGYSEKDLEQLQSICEDMKRLITELADDKRKAEEEVRLFTSNVATMELAMSVQDERVRELACKVETLEEQNTRLAADKQALDSEVLSLLQQKEALEKENEGVYEALAVENQSKSKDEEDDMSKDLLQLISEKEELAKELVVITVSRDKMKTELESLQKRVEDTEYANESRITELTDANRDAEKQVQVFASNVKNMEAEVSAKEVKVQELASAVESAEEQNKKLPADNEALNGEILTLRHQMEALEKETAMTVVNSAEELRKSVEEKDKIQQEFYLAIKGKEASDKEMGQKLAEVEEENKRLSKSINLLMKELVLVNNDVNDSVPQSVEGNYDAEKSLETKVADNLSIVSALRLKLRFFRKDNEDLQQSISEKDKKLAQMEKQLEMLITARDSQLTASASTAAVEQALEEERKKSDALIAERETERDKAELNRVRIVELEDQVSELMGLESELVSSKTQLDEEVQKLQSEKKALEEKEENQRDQIDKLKLEIADGANKITALEESLEKERVEIRSISEKLAKLTKDVEITVAEAGSAANTLDDVRTIMANDANTLATVKSQIAMLEDQKRDVDDALLSVTKDRDELEEKCESAFEELRELQEKLESAVGMGVAFVDKAERYKKDVAALTIKRDAAEQLAKEFHAENEANIAKCAHLEQTVASMKIEREVFVKESKAAIANANERLNKRMKDCDRQLTTLFPPLHPARKDNRLKFEDMISLLQEERASVLAKVKSLEEETEAAQDESAILEQQVHILSKEVSKYKRQNKEIIRALKEVNVGRSEKSDIPMDEVAVDTQVEQRLGKLKQFMHDRLLE